MASYMQTILKLYTPEEALEVIETLKPEMIVETTQFFQSETAAKSGNKTARKSKKLEEKLPEN